MRSNDRDPDVSQPRLSTASYLLFTAFVVTAIIVVGVFMS
jgi:hypothetical protein